MYRRLRVCSSGGGFEAVPSPPVRLNLANARRLLEAEGVAVVDARVMLIAGTDPETTISANGRMLFKTRDARAAERTFEHLRVLLGLPGLEPATP
jgi:hypothetical protein